MDEMNKFIKEQENLPFSAIGEKCSTKTDAITKKAQELDIPWKQINCMADNGEFRQLHTYAIIDGRKIDVAYDSDTTKILKDLSHRQIYDKTIYNEHFSKKHTWQQVMSSLMFYIGRNARILDSSVWSSLDKKRIVYVDNDSFDREDLEDFASKFGVSCYFRKIEEGIISVTFSQTGKDITKKYQDPYEIKNRKQNEKMHKDWFIRDNRLRDLEKE